MNQKIAKSIKRAVYKLAQNYPEQFAHKLYQKTKKLYNETPRLKRKDFDVVELLNSRNILE